MHKTKPVILLLGTFHMQSSNDMVNTELDELYAEKKQNEIKQVVNRLKQFEPTKIAVEAVVGRDEELNAQYHAYRRGESKLQRSEVYQLGFRLASVLNHERIYAIDWMEQGEGKRGLGEVYEWAKANQPELFHAIFKNLPILHSDKNKSILGMFQNYNDPVFLKNNHKLYMDIAKIGEFENYVGIDWLIWWYQRNLILFSNLTRLADSPKERILLIIGAAHIQLLFQFLQESEDYEVEWAHTYLR
jgi:hypothetical protein